MNHGATCFAKRYSFSDPYIMTIKSSIYYYAMQCIEVFLKNLTIEYDLFPNMTYLSIQCYEIPQTC